MPGGFIFVQPTHNIISQFLSGFESAIYKLGYSNLKSHGTCPLRNLFFLLLPTNWYLCRFSLYFSFSVRSLTTQALHSCRSSLPLMKTITVFSHDFSQISHSIIVSFVNLKLNEVSHYRRQSILSSKPLQG